MPDLRLLSGRMVSACIAFVWRLTSSVDFESPAIVAVSHNLTHHTSIPQDKSDVLSQTWTTATAPAVELAASF